MAEQNKRQLRRRNNSAETISPGTSEDVHFRHRNAAAVYSKKVYVGRNIGTRSPYRNAAKNTLIASKAKKNICSVAQRIKSAKLLQLKQMENELNAVKIRRNELAGENAVLKKLQKRQSAALDRFEGSHSVLGRLNQSHAETIRSIKMEMRQTKALGQELTKQLKVCDKKLEALREQHRRLLNLSRHKHLGERDELQQQLKRMQSTLKDKQANEQMLERKLFFQRKSFVEQFSSLSARQKVAANDLDDAVDKITELKRLVRERRKYIAANFPQRHPGPHAPAAPLQPPARGCQDKGRTNQEPDTNQCPENTTEKNSDNSTLNERDAEEVVHDGTLSDAVDEDYDDSDSDSDEDEWIILNKKLSEILAEQQLKYTTIGNGLARIEETRESSDYNTNDSDDGRSGGRDTIDNQKNPKIEQESEINTSHAFTNQGLTNIPHTIEGGRADSQYDSVASQNGSTDGKEEVHGEGSYKLEMEKALSPCLKPELEEINYSRRLSRAISRTSMPEKQPATERESVTLIRERRKKENDLSFLSNLITEIDRDKFLKMNSRNARAGSQNRKSLLLNRERCGEAETPATVTRTKNSHQETGCEKDTGKSIPELKVAGGMPQLKEIRKVWDDFPLRREANQAMTAMEGEEEVNDSTSTPLKGHSDKNNLLAALKAIDDGTDLIDFKGKEEGKNNFSSGNRSHIVLDLSLGIPTQKCTGLSLYQKPSKESENCEEKYSNVQASLPQCTDLEMPKEMADVLQELFRPM